jgi:hypothetical protein
LIFTIDPTQDDLIRSLQVRAIVLDQGANQQTRHVLVNRVLSRIPESRAIEFKERLRDLIREFNAADNESVSQAFALRIAYYPQPETE